MIKPEIRKDYFKDEYVIIAPNRVRKSFEVKPVSETNEGKICHFCPENFRNEKVTYRDNNEKGDWEIVSIVNRFAALSVDNNSAYGQAEVVIETRKHGMDINDFSVDHIARVFDAYINRYDSLHKMPGIKHVIVFKNEGGNAGASVSHTHSQIMALPILPLKVENEARDYSKYRLEKNTCPYCDIIKLESDRPRVIWQDENLFTLAPYASVSPYGAWLIPKRHVRVISDLNRGEKESIAKALKIILDKLDEFGLAYNYFIENAVNGEDYHMHIKVAPRPNIWGGLELGTGVIINPITPEYAARMYRNKTKITSDPRF